MNVKNTAKKVGKVLRKAPAAAAIFLIRAYQMILSPHFPGCCRFHPTCSHYGIIAIRKHGLAKGVWLTLKRLSKCRPGGPYGYDPVP